MNADLRVSDREADVAGPADRIQVVTHTCRAETIIWDILVAFLALQSVAAFVYGLTHPELSQMQVLLAAGEWSIPARWM